MFSPPVPPLRPAPQLYRNGMLHPLRQCKIELYTTDNMECVRDHVVSAVNDAELKLGDSVEDNIISFKYDARRQKLGYHIAS